jgi:hypothetical protein
VLGDGRPDSRNEELEHAEPSPDPYQ